MKALAASSIAIWAALLIAAPAFAGTAVTLKADASDADGVVTLGEIFDGAGAAGRTPVASRTGNTVMLNAQAVRLAAAGIERATVEDMSTLTADDVASAAGAEGTPAAEERKGLRRRRR